MNVLLVHGLGRTPCSLFGLASHLRRAGHSTSFFAYSPTLEPLARIVSRLTARLQVLSERGEPIGLAAHSLGGILLRQALAQSPTVRVHHLVMMGTPNQPPRMAARLWKWRAFRLLSGECGGLLASPTAIPSLPPPTVPYTLIAGTSGPRHPRLPFGDELNDGVVALSESRIQNEDEPKLVPAFHSFIMDHPSARRLVAEAFASGPSSSSGVNR